jgi:hypothetical protein
MNRLSHNELIGAVALQSALENSLNQQLSLAKSMLVLPLLFDKTVRAVLKNRNSVVLSSKDLLISKPSAFITVRARYEALAITSLNTILLAQELGMAALVDDGLVLKKKIFFQSQSDIGKFAKDILTAGPKVGLILREAVSDLYQNFRIEL